MRSMTDKRFLEPYSSYANEKAHGVGKFFALGKDIEAQT